MEGAIFEFAVDNDGSVMVDGTGTLTISDQQNNELASIPFEVDTVLAKEPTFYYIDYPIVLADGDYLLTSVAQYRALREDDTVHTTTLSGIELTIVNGQPRIPAPGVRIFWPSNNARVSDRAAFDHPSSFVCFAGSHRPSGFGINPAAPRPTGAGPGRTGGLDHSPVGNRCMAQHPSKPKELAETNDAVWHGAPVSG